MIWMIMAAKWAKPMVAILTISVEIIIMKMRICLS